MATAPRLETESTADLSNAIADAVQIAEDAVSHRHERTEVWDVVHLHRRSIDAETLRAVEQIGSAATEFRQTAQRLNAPGGPLERVTAGTDALADTMEMFSASTLPRLNRVADETTRTVRSLDRAINELTENPQMLIYGEGPAQPGPGEPGFGGAGARR